MKNFLLMFSTQVVFQNADYGDYVYLLVDGDEFNNDKIYYSYLSISRKPCINFF